MSSLLFYNLVHTCKQNMMDAINDLKEKLESVSYTAAAAKGVLEADVKKKDGVRVCVRAHLCARVWLCMYAHMRVCTCVYACVLCACACACACVCAGTCACAVCAILTNSIKSLHPQPQTSSRICEPRWRSRNSRPRRRMKRSSRKCKRISQRPRARCRR